MKFNIGTIDTDHDGHQASVYRTHTHSSSSSNYTYFKEEGIPGFWTNEKFGGPEMSLEIEKEEIELEQEVRNEMMMRNTGVQQFILPTLLHQTLPLNTKKEGKPNGETTLSGLKRKSTPAASEGSSESRGEVSKKKQATVEWSCAVCQVSATSERGLNEHVEGKKHKVKEAALIASKTGGNFGLGVAAKKPIVKLGLTTVDLRAKKPEMGKSSNTRDSDKYKFWCEICEVGAFSEKVMNNHKDGKKHLKSLSEKAKLEKEVKTERNEERQG